MKNKIAVSLVTLVLAVAFAGCIASNTTPAVYTPAANAVVMAQQIAAGNGSTQAVAQHLANSQSPT